MEEKKYYILYDREGCIGAAACVAVSPERYVLNDEDGKADLVDGEKQEDGKWKYWITEDQVEIAKEAAEACPVAVIHVYDSEGNKLCSC